MQAYRNTDVSCCSIIVCALLSFPSFSAGRDTVAESEASLSEPWHWALSVSRVRWCASSQPAGWYNLCNYPQIYLLHNGGVSCFVGCGSPWNPGPGQCQGPLALCWWQESPHKSWPLLFMPLPVPRGPASATASAPPLGFLEPQC